MNKIFLATILTVAGFSTANAVEWNNPDAMRNDNRGFMAKSSVSQTSIVDSDMVNCWGWDGSNNGQTKRMSRADCLNQNGTVSFRTITNTRR